MTILFTLMILGCLFSRFVENSGELSEGGIYKRSQRQYVLVILLAFLLSLVTGTRTGFNDTLSYFNTYNGAPSGVNSIIPAFFSADENAGFYAFVVLCKTVLPQSQHIFIFICTLLATTSFFLFFLRYCKDFSFCIFLYFTGGLFLLSMGAVKQILAMSMGIWAVPALLNEKYLKSFLLLGIAFFFHPYIIFYLIAPFFKGKIWCWRTFFMLVCAIIFGVCYQKMLPVALDINSFVAGVETTDETYEYFQEAQGMSPFRLAVFAIPPLLSFLYRKKIDFIADKFDTCFICLSIVIFAVSIIGSFGAANMFGRIALYFLPFQIAAFAWMIKYAAGSSGNSLKNAAYVCYTCFFVYSLMGKEFSSVLF